MFLYDGLSQYFEGYFEEGYHCVKALKKKKMKRKKGGYSVVVSICSG